MTGRPEGSPGSASGEADADSGPAAPDVQVELIRDLTVQPGLGDEVVGGATPRDSGCNNTS